MGVDRPLIDPSTHKYPNIQPDSQPAGPCVVKNSQAFSRYLVQWNGLGQHIGWLVLNPQPIAHLLVI